MNLYSCSENSKNCKLVQFVSDRLPDIVDEVVDKRYAEISSDEVDRIVAALEELMESASSENIKTHLEEALNGIYYLVYDEEAGDGEAGDGEDDGEILAEAA